MGSVTSGHMDNNISDLIGPSELATSSQLVQRIIARGTSQENARQIVRRHSARNGIWRSERVILPGGGRVFGRSAFIGTEGFRTAVMPILSEHRPGLARMVESLQQQQTILKPHAEMLFP